MTEKEKMRAGEWYDANYDKELLDMRLKAEQYCFDFNNSRPQSAQQTESLERILGTEIPEGVTVLATAFERSDEENKIEPKRMIILSVEGDETERTYFQHLNTHLDRALIQIEVLRHRRSDGYSDPRHVIELLDEYSTSPFAK